MIGGSRFGDAKSGREDFVFSRERFDPRSEDFISGREDFVFSRNDSMAIAWIRGLFSLRGLLAASALLAFLLIFSPGALLAGCQETDSTSEAAMEDSRIRYESRESFPEHAEARSVIDSCLSGFAGFPVNAGVDLAPLPDLSEITERLCRRTSTMVFGKAPYIAPIIRRMGSMNSVNLNEAIADEIARALE